MTRMAGPGNFSLAEWTAGLRDAPREGMNELALFAGAGGGILGSKLLGWRTVGYVEWEREIVRRLVARIRDGLIDDAPVWADAQTFDGRPWRGAVDVVTGGFPCQPFSTAGKRLGKDDPRNMWPATLRIIREVRPRWCLVENVPGIIAPYLGVILGGLAEAGYDAWWSCLPASALGAPHRRERLWVVAHANDILYGQY